VTTEKIHVRLIDGTEVFVPINARHIDGNRYELLDDKEYEYEDSNYLFEFYPEDIIELRQHKFSDGNVRQVAKELIQLSTRTDREYLEFKFRATLGEIPINKMTADKYRKDIERIKKEKKTGQFIYPSLLETVEKLDVLNK